MTVGNSPKQEGPGGYVGDTFWLAHAAKLIEQSHHVLTRQAERVAAAAAWFWTAYLAYLALSHPKGQRLGILGAAPAVLLILAYLCATLAQGPQTGGFDPRVPDQIRSSHNSSMAQRQVRLRWSYALLMVSGALICVSLVVA